METIYRIICPETKDVVYIGRTKCPLKYRLSRHISNPNRSMRSWVYRLTKNNLNPIIEPIETVASTLAEQRELYWIDKYSHSVKLFNTIDNKAKCSIYNIPKRFTKRLI